MSNKQANQYIQSKVTSASSKELISIIYAELIKSLNIVKVAFEDKSLLEETVQKERAIKCIYMLLDGLDEEKGGDIAASLKSLYTFSISSIVKSSTEKDMNKIIEVYEQINEGWQTV